MVPRQLHAKFGSRLLSVLLLAGCGLCISCKNDVPVEAAGQIVDESGLPISGAEVLLDGKVQALTDRTGHFAFRAFLNSKAAHKITISKQDASRYFSEFESDLKLGSNRRYQTSLNVRLLSMPKQSVTGDLVPAIQTKSPAPLAVPIAQTEQPVTHIQVATSHPHPVKPNHSPAIVLTAIPSRSRQAITKFRNVYIRSYGKALHLATARAFDPMTGELESGCTTNEHGKCRLPIPDAKLAQPLEVLVSHPTQISKLTTLHLEDSGPQYVDLEPGMSVTVAAALTFQAGTKPALGVEVLADGIPVGTTTSNGLLIHTIARGAQPPTITMRNPHFIPASSRVTLTTRESTTLEPKFSPRTCLRSLSWEIGPIPDPYDSAPKDIVLARLERALESVRQSLGYQNPKEEDMCEPHQLVVSLGSDEIWSFEVALKPYFQDPEKIAIKHSVSQPYDGSAMEEALKEALTLLLRSRAFNSSVHTSSLNSFSIHHDDAPRDFHRSQLADVWVSRQSNENAPVMLRQAKIAEVGIDTVSFKTANLNQNEWATVGQLVRVRASTSSESIGKLAISPARPVTPSNSGVTLQ